MIHHCLLPQFCHDNLNTEVSLDINADETDHDDPDEEEGVADENDARGNLINIIQLSFLKEWATLHDDI